MNFGFRKTSINYNTPNQIEYDYTSFCSFESGEARVLYKWRGSPKSNVRDSGHESDIMVPHQLPQLRALHRHLVWAKELSVYDWVSVLVYTWRK